MGGASVSAWDAMGVALSRLLQEALPSFTWMVVAAGCVSGVAIACFGIYVAARRLVHARPGRPEPVDGVPAPGFDEELVDREVARGIAALESWLAQASPWERGDDEAGSSAEG
jgi:hypothetical protein